MWDATRRVWPCLERYVAGSVTSQQQVGNDAEGEHQIVVSAKKE